MPKYTLVQTIGQTPLQCQYVSLLLSSLGFRRVIQSSTSFRLGCPPMAEDLAAELGKVEKELEQKIAEASHVGDLLIEFGSLLKDEPWEVATSGQGVRVPREVFTHRARSDIDRAIEISLASQPVRNLLRDIRELRARKDKLEEELGK